MGLSMDAFAVAICKGFAMNKKLNYRFGFLLALYFGFFQALMPLAGWIAGSYLKKYIINTDHWIAFILLSFIGGKMIYDSFTDTNDDDTDYSVYEIISLAVATSIDALVLGIGLSILKVKIIYASAVIGITTFILSMLGILIGYNFGSRLKLRAELAGGIVLIVIGLKILLEHLEIVKFG